jgi:hypothetical protein
MTEERLQYIGGQCLTSLGQLALLPRCPLSELLSTLGKDGSPSLTDTIATLTPWYDTLDMKDKAKFWTLIVDFYTLLMPAGIASRDSNYYSRS